jgi:tight adherence protein B
MRRLAALVVALGFTGIGLAAPAVAADDTAITHVEAHDGTLDVLVSIPAGAAVDLDGVTLTVDGASASATAAVAGSTQAPAVRRTTVLAIDTSDSMNGARFAAARSAAKTYLASVPADVEVGIVSFDGAVHTVLAPTTARAAARTAIDGLKLAHGTLLYDGVRTAVEQLGTEGQRTVLVLSDGKDTGKAPLAEVQKAIKDAGVQLDAVALDQKDSDLAALRSLTAVGSGQLIDASTKALEQAFAAEAAVLTRQVLVTAELPSSVPAGGADVEVRLPVADGATLTASTYAVIGKPAARDVAAEITETASSLQLPRTALYGGLAAIAFGLLVVAVSVVGMTSNRDMRSIQDRIAAYGPSAVAPAPGARKGESTAFNLAQAKDAAATMLHRNQGLEARIEKRLAAAGSALKPAEWLLLHGTIAILGGLVGVVLGGGSIFLLVAGLAAGLLVPWMWLGHKRKKRVNAFNSGLSDTLQLLSGSLSAGMSLAQAIDSVVNEGSEPIAGEFRRVLIESRLGVPLEAALEGIAHRIESVDFAWVVMAIRIQREVGGNLAELLNSVAETLRERDYLRRQVKTLSAEGRLSAYILIALPIGMFGFMMVSRGEYIRPLYTTGLGFMMLTAFVVLLSIGWFTMSRIVKVEV